MELKDYTTDKDLANINDILSIWLDCPEEVKDVIVNRAMLNGREIIKSDVLVEYGTYKHGCKIVYEYYRSHGCSEMAAKHAADGQNGITYYLLGEKVLA